MRCRPGLGEPADPAPQVGRRGRTRWDHDDRIGGRRFHCGRPRASTDPGPGDRHDRLGGGLGPDQRRLGILGQLRGADGAGRHHRRDRRPHQQSRAGRGAMIVSPDYGPMAALSVALVNRAWRPAWRSFRALALGFPVAALAALLLTLAARGLGRIPAPYLAGQRPLTGLLIGANLGAFVVAFVAGAAGIIALGRARSGAVVGVVVSITTIPAASNVGVALAMGNLSEAGKSLSILLVNLAGLLIGGVLTLLGTRVWARRIEAGRSIVRPKPKPGR